MTIRRFQDPGFNRRGDRWSIFPIPPLPLLALAFLGFGRVHGQVVPPPPVSADSTTVVPAEYCASSSIFSTFAGPGYRPLWTTAIKVPVADLGELGGGGLTPLRVGGGMTTRTLHSMGADGRRYVFRSVQKATRQALAEEFWGTPVEAVMRDQLCSFHPSGAVIVARLLDAVGVLHPEPQFLVIPDDPRLGEFREQFAGMLVLFEERPDDLADGEPGFGGSHRIVQTDDLFSHLGEHPDDRVDLPSLLRSRLVDLLVGDRDRSINNHLWARFDEEDGRHYWRPIPRDRDQSFVRFDGVIKELGRNYDPRLVSFEDEYPDIEGLTRNAWDIDRNLLVGLDRNSWDSVIEQVAEAISDRVIAEAVGRMPREHYDLLGEEIEASLRHRRDRLGEAAAELYEIVFHEADIHATDEDEVAVLDRMDGGEVGVSFYRREAGSETMGTPHFQRTFSPDETKELRIYLHGGDDLIRVEGSSESPIVLRIVGGGGDDELINSSGSGGVFLYDDDNDTRLGGQGTKLVRQDAPRPYSWWLEGEAGLDHGVEGWPALGLGYDGDRGLVVYVGHTRDRYGFLKEPYSSRLQVKAGWAVGLSQPIVDYRHYLQSVLGGGDLQVRGRYSGFEVVRFYGLGNQTEESEPNSFYEVHQKQLVLSTSLSFGDGDRRMFNVGPVFRRTASDTTNPVNFVTTSQAYGTGTFLQAGLEASIAFDERDIRSAPTKGFHITGGASYYPPALDVENSFGEVHGEAAVYLSPGSKNPTLALRVGGKHLWGAFPYSDAAYLGGSENVRGLREQRFAGDGSVYGSAELRVFLTRFLFLFPIDLGVFGFSDFGRVFMDGQPAGEWHNSGGGGIWLAPVTRSATVQFSVAENDGRKAFYVGMGFGY
jgi:hypothetical protein